MYYPVQIPYILNEKFGKNLTYTEEVVEELQGFVICFWEIFSLRNMDHVINNIIVPDGCIDLVINYETKQVFFSGMSETEFNNEISHPAYYLGARLKPGAFYQLTNIPAYQVMDQIISIDIVSQDFDTEVFFALSYDDGKRYMKNYLNHRMGKIQPSDFVLLFDSLIDTEIPISAEELYKRLNFSPRQCQRLFLKHYGISPKMVLSVLRFQECLRILTSSDVKPVDVFSIAGYYDQPHFIKDIKKNIGITPLELIKKYK